MATMELASSVAALRGRHAESTSVTSATRSARAPCRAERLGGAFLRGGTMGVRHVRPSVGATHLKDAGSTSRRIMKIGAQAAKTTSPKIDMDGPIMKVIPTA
eukprot:1172477-Prorocentrum_minimum.AAC.2